MRLIPRHNYLVLSPLHIYGLNSTLLYVNENEIVTGAYILKLRNYNDFTKAMGFRPQPVYCLNTRRVYLLCIDTTVIPPNPHLITEGGEADVHLVPLQLLLDLNPGKLPKYIDHRYKTVKYLARYLLAHQ